MLKEDENGIWYFSDYLKYRRYGEVNHNFNKKNGGYILDVKSENAFERKKGVSYFTDLILEEFSNYTFENIEVKLTCVPRSGRDSICKGMVEILNNISCQYNNFQYVQLLNRNIGVPKKATGGLRSKRLEKNTIGVLCPTYNMSPENYIKGKNIMLFDDITTTGNSLLACKEILEETGARKVICLALGKTQK